MKTARKLIFALAFGVLAGCAGAGGNSPEATRVIAYAEYARESVPPDSSFLSDACRIRLRMDDRTSGMKSLDKVVIRDRKLWILDAFSRKIVVFNRTGNPVEVLDRLGRGPGEYLSIEDFCIDPRGHVFVSDPRTARVIEYDPDLAFVRQWTLPYVTNQLASLPNGNFLMSLLPVNEGAYAGVELLVVDSAFRDIRPVLKYDAPVSLDEVIDLPRISCSRYGICYHRTVDDRAYVLGDDGEIEQTVRFDFGRFTVPEKHRTQLEANLKYYTRYITLEACFAIAEDRIYGVLYDKSREAFFMLDTAERLVRKKEYEVSPDKLGKTEYPIGTSGDYFITCDPSAGTDGQATDPETDGCPLLRLYEL